MTRTCTLKGNPFQLEGTEVKIGDKAPDATLKKSLVDDVRLAETAGAVRILSVVPSLDTPVCAEQTRRFYKEANSIPHVKLITISCDLPVAMSRFCAAEGLDAEKLLVLSDHKDASFGKAYGTLIPDLRIQSRAVFVLDKDNTVQYAEYVDEVAEHPNYEAALECARGLV